ncbi:hypothetical protein amb2920 [Paramagnetospirillum magneticum AMB-1]|uniref:DUF2946 domain-containing protein n=1 Tax=Paramagnetospirillum magneticum (strain ATCC 700264 / AMB-1) TaxID=342108 RepID=Q2W351_PARM1|nr:hypothetical protein amb2920 [Paramagnetospirillum magneticum AMB-1]
MPLMAAMRGSMVSVRGKASVFAKRGSCLGRFAAWAGALALALQILLPLAPAQAALSVDRELAASICHSGAGDDAPAPAMAPHDHCQFCQIHTGAKLLLPELAPIPVSMPAALFALMPPGDGGVAGNPGHLPHPQRGPPSIS